MLSYGGSPDLTFGAQGYFATILPSSTAKFVPNSLITQADGKVIEAGYLEDTPAQGNGPATISLAVARFNADGSPDASFGSGGFFTSPALSRDLASSPAIDVLAFGATAQPDGRIVVVGEDQGVATVLRLTTAGALDPTFGTGGIVSLGTQATADGKLDIAAKAAIRPDGTIAVGGFVAPSLSRVVPAVELLDADGPIVTAFGTAGLAIVPAPVGTSGFVNPLIYGGGEDRLVVQPDGKLVVAASAYLAGSTTLTEAVLTRFAADGTLDASFGTGGQAVLKASSIVPGLPSLDASTLVLQVDGKLVVGGSVAYYLVPNVLSFRAAVLRLDADGTLDPGFGVGGADILINDGTAYGSPSSMTLQADGKILLAYPSAYVVRIDANGLPDISFGNAGSAYPAAEPVPYALYSGAGIAVEPDGKIIVGAFTFKNDTREVGLIRLLDHGAVGDYDGDGISDPAAYDTTTATFVDVPSAGGTAASTPIGDPGVGLTLPVPGAYDGQGISEVAVYRVGLGAFEIRPFNGGPAVILPFGTPGFGKTIPAPGDYDHAGRTELGAYLPDLGAYFYRAVNLVDVMVPIGPKGANSSIPAPADYFGTGQDDVAVYSVADGAFLIRNPVTAEILAVPFGTPGPGASIPAPGDYDGSGHAELAVYLPASGTLVYRPAAGGPDVSIAVGQPGVAQSLPAIGDYAGLGHAEAAVYEPSSGTLFHVPSPGGPVISAQVGVAGESIPFSTGPEAVAVSGIGSSGSPGVRAASVEVPLTPDVLDGLTGIAPKKKAGHA